MNHSKADRSRRLRAIGLVCILALAVQASPASAESQGAEAGLGVGSALCSLIYGPVKITYAILGSVFGGFAWALSAGDPAVATAVVTPAVRGDYVITPSHLRGERPIEFIGRDPAYRDQVGYQQ